MPRNSNRHVERCTADWLVLTVNISSTACGAAPAPGCSAPPAVTRFFLRWADRWALVAGTTTAGCDVVLRTAPTFPRSLCRDLPATR